MDTLPLELLIQVIGFASLDAFKETPLAVHPHLAVPLSHVCRRWRNATLNVSSFWCIVYNWYSRDLVLACLARSRALPLRIRVDLATVDAHQWFIDLLPTTMYRAYSLCIRQLGRCKDPRGMLSKILPALHRPAPCLKEFTIDIDVRNPIFLPIIFSGKTPTLRHLSFRSILWSPGNIFKGLTYLELLSGSRAQCQCLIDVLRSNPLLETLLLSGAFPSTIAAERRIKLPRLRKLDIRDSPWTVVHRFLAQIELPPHCQLVYITGSMAPERNDHVLTSVLPTDLTYLHPFDRPTKLILGAPYTMSLCGSNATSCSTFEIFSSWVLDQQTFFEQSVASLIAISQRGSLMLEDVRELWLGPLGGSHIPAKPVVSPPVEMWAQLFDAMPQLETLAILPGFHFVDILSALLPDEAGQIAVCPRLNTIRIVCGRYHALLPWSMIWNVVQVRKAAGKPIRRLLVQDFHSQMPKQERDWGGVLFYESLKCPGGGGCPILANEQFQIWSENLRELLMR